MAPAGRGPGPGQEEPKRSHHRTCPRTLTAHSYRRLCVLTRLTPAPDSLPDAPSPRPSAPTCFTSTVCRQPSPCSRPPSGNSIPAPAPLISTTEASVRVLQAVATAGPGSWRADRAHLHSAERGALSSWPEQRRHQGPRAPGHGRKPQVDRQTCWPCCSPLHSQEFLQEQDQISEHKSNHHPGRISSDNKVNKQVIKGKILVKRQNANFFQRRLG